MRCEAMYGKSGIQCGLPKGHTTEHSKADGAVNTTWDETNARYPEVPVFKVKASDPFSLAIIRCWIVMASAYKQVIGKEIIKISQEKLEGAEQRFQEFSRWQAENGTKVPD